MLTFFLPRIVVLLKYLPKPFNFGSSYGESPAMTEQKAAISDKIT